MLWLAIVLALLATIAVHELVAFALARVLGGAARRRVAIVWIEGKRRVALAMLGAAAAAYLAVSAAALGYYASRGGVPTGRGWWSVGEVKRDLPAAIALRERDRVLAIDDHALSYGDSMAERVNAGGGAPVKFTIERDGGRLDVHVQPVRRDDHWLVGIVPRIEYETDPSPGLVLAASLRYPVVQARAFAREGFRSAEHADPGGPMRIIDEYQTADDTGPAWQWFLRMMVVLLLALVVLDLVRAGQLVVLGSRA